MSGLDEYLIHNNPLPVRVMWTSDMRAYERVWFTAQDRTGTLFVVCGLAFYPNLGTAEAFAIVVCHAKHTTVRSHRHLGDDRMDMRVGPLDFEVVRPFREWRLGLDHNDQGLAYELRFYDTKRAMYRNIGVGTIAAGQAYPGVAGYEGFGSVEGIVDVGGETFTLEPGAYCGTRDHHWGIRDGVGGRAHWSGHQHVFSGYWVEFAEWGLWGDQLLVNLGSPERRNGIVRRVRSRLRFDSETQLLVAGEAQLELDGGVLKTMTFERMGNQVAYLRCGMYGGPNGGTPGTDVWMGQDVGEVTTGETYDLGDPQTRLALSGLNQLHARFDCEGEVAYGIVELYEPLAYEAASRGRFGLELQGSG